MYGTYELLYNRVLMKGFCMLKKLFCTIFTILLTSGLAFSENSDVIKFNNDVSSIKLEPVRYVSAGHILVDSYDEAIALKKRIDEGENFERLAQKYSKCPSAQRGGALGSFGRGQMVKPFENAAFNLNVGEVSEPVKTDFGWHLIKVYDRKS